MEQDRLLQDSIMVTPSALLFKVNALTLARRVPGFQLCDTLEYCDTVTVSGELLDDGRR